MDVASLGHERSMKLEGASNWIVWKNQTRVVLKAMEVFKITDGTTKLPELPTQAEAWHKKDTQAQAFLVTRMSPKILILISNCQTANDIWSKLHTVFEQKSDGASHLLHQKFFEIKFQEGEDVATFISRVESLTTAIKEIGEEVSEKMVVTKIITCLPECYRHFPSAWESVAEDQRTLNNLTARLLTEEQRCSAINGQETERGAFVAKTASRKCFKCGKPGHYKKDCRSQPRRPSKTCNFCNKPGHEEERCWSKHGTRAAPKENAFMMFPVSLISELGKPNNHWILDSGASHHMCNNRELFCGDFVNLSVPKGVIIGDGSTIQATGRGRVDLQAFNGHEWIPTTLNDVLYVPNLQINLFSLAIVMDKNFELKTGKKKCFFVKNGVRAVADRVSNFYVMRFRYENTPEIGMIGKSCDGLSKWHSKMVHQNLGQVKSILKRSNVAYNEGEEQTCVPCLKGKQHRLSFPNSVSKTSKPGELIHMDLCGPMESPSLGGAKYFLLIKDDLSKYRKVFFLSNKN